jgi:hypothetical protein
MAKWENCCNMYIYTTRPCLLLFFVFYLMTILFDIWNANAWIWRTHLIDASLLLYVAGHSHNWNTNDAHNAFTML